MNLIKESKYLFHKRTFFKGFQGIEGIYFRLRLSIHHKSSPPLKKKTKKSDLFEIKPEENLPMKFDRVQRDIFGATILPQNLSFENSKKLTENQIKLQDIPVVDENSVAEVLMAEKEKKRKKSNTPEVAISGNIEDDSGVVVIDAALNRQQMSTEKPAGELFRIEDSSEQIPGRKIIRIFLDLVNSLPLQPSVASLFQFLKKKVIGTFCVSSPKVKLPDILGSEIVMISRPEHVSAIFEQDRRHPVNSTFDSIQRARLLQYKKNPSEHYCLSEDEWESLRHSGYNNSVKESEKYFEEIDEASSKFLRRIRIIRDEEDEVPDDFLFEINKWSLECLCRVIFDNSFGFSEYESATCPLKSSQLLYILTVASKNFCNLETGFQLWRFVNTYSLLSLSWACSILENVISENVARAQINLIRRRDFQGPKGLSSLVERLLLEEGASREDVVNHILDTLLIGTNTMSVALGFLFYHLSQNPRCQTELWKEIKIVLPEKYSRLEYEQLSSLKYLKACLKESLRLKMPMPIIPRVLSNDVILGKHRIPKGTFVLLAAQLESSKEQNFSDPMEFYPERWFDLQNDCPFSLLPMRSSEIDGGTEKFFTEVSIWTCASHVIRHFLIEYFHEEIQATNTIISFPNKPLKFKFIERKN